MSLPVIVVKPESEQAIEWFKQRPQRFAQALMFATRHAAAMLAGAVSEKMRGGDPLNVVTGQLWRSVKSRVTHEGDAIIAEIGVLSGPATAYARIHEEGGEIRPTKGRALAVPLDAAKTPGGKPRFPGGPREAAKKYPEMFMLKQKGKPPLLGYPERVRGSGKGRVKGFVPLYVLVPRVTIRAKHWLSGGVQRSLGVWEVAWGEDLAKRIGA